MKYLSIILLFQLVLTFSANGQMSSVIIPSNTSTGSLEKNLLLHAQRRFTVTRQGPSIALTMLFDGKMSPASTATAPSTSTPLVILIEDIPSHHTQTGAWIGWSSRYLNPESFKIEAYNISGGVNEWVTIAVEPNYSPNHFMIEMPLGSFTKLRFTFYQGSSNQSSSSYGLLQLSELFYIHPEAVAAYDGLMVQYSKNGNVGIGTDDPQAKLAVNGNILAKEIKIKTDISVPDYVFEPDYDLPTLAEIEAHVKEHKHLPEIPSATDVARDGLDLAEMNLLLLKKVEELTLHLIQQQKRIEQLEQQVKKQP